MENTLKVVPFRRKGEEKEERGQTKKVWVDVEDWKTLIQAALRKRKELKSAPKKVVEELRKDFPDYDDKLLFSALSASKGVTDSETFGEMLHVAKGLLHENPEVSKGDLIQKLFLLYKDEEKVVVKKAAAIAFKRFKDGRQQRQEASEAVKIWFDANPSDHKRDHADIAHDILNELKPNAGHDVIEGVVSDFFRKKKKKLEEECRKLAIAHFSANPKDSRHPGEIAKELLTENDLPLRMLTAILGQEQEKLFKEERKRLVALANNHRRVKKPGSSFRRGQGLGSKNGGEGGAKKRGVKG